MTDINRTRWITITWEPGQEIQFSHGGFHAWELEAALNRVLELLEPELEPAEHTEE